MASPVPESIHIEVLRSCDYSICRIFGAEENMPDLLRALKDGGILKDEQVQRLLKRKSNHDMMKGLLPILKGEDARVFFKFLKVLQHRSQHNPSHKDHTRLILNIMIKGLEGASISDFRLPPESESIISEMLEDLRKYVKPTDTTITTLSSTTMGTVSNDSRFRFEHFPVEKQVMSSKCASFYSPRHGILIRFLQPVFTTSSKFTLFLCVCDPEKVRLPSDYQICTPIVWLSTEPAGLNFPVNSIQVSIPHCASITCIEDVESLELLSVQNKQENLLNFTSNPCILKADFSDGCHMTFKTNHFTYYTGVLKERKRSRFQWYDTLLNKRATIAFMPDVKRSNRLVEDITAECILSEVPKRIVQQSDYHDDRCISDGSNLSVEVTCAMPIDRSSNFHVIFLVSAPLPTYDQVKLKQIENYLKKGSDHLHIHTESLVLIGKEVVFDLIQAPGTSGWTVQSLTDSSPPKLSLGKEMLFGMQLPCKIFQVTTKEPPTGCLKCSISVRGKFLDCERVVFDIVSTKSEGPKQNDGSIITIFIDKCIFDKTSNLLKTLENQINHIKSSHDISLDIDIREHHRFIVCLCYKLAQWESIAHCLKIQPVDMEYIKANYGSGGVGEQAYQMICRWVVSSETSSICVLFKALKANNIKTSLTNRIEPQLDLFVSDCTSSPLDTLFLLKISHEIELIWKTMARLLGLCYKDVESVQVQNCGEKLDCISYEMLLKWKQIDSINATYISFLRALLIMKDTDPIQLINAWRTTKTHVGNFGKTCFV